MLNSNGCDCNCGSRRLFRRFGPKCGVSEKQSQLLLRSAASNAKTNVVGVLVVSDDTIILQDQVRLALHVHKSLIAYSKLPGAQPCPLRSPSLNLAPQSASNRPTPRDSHRRRSALCAACSDSNAGFLVPGNAEPGILPMSRLWQSDSAQWLAKPAPHLDVDSGADKRRRRRHRHGCAAKAKWPAVGGGCWIAEGGLGPPSRPSVEDQRADECRTRVHRPHTTREVALRPGLESSHSDRGHGSCG